MKNADMPAMPQSITHSVEGGLICSADFANCQGLTKREYFAVHSPVMAEEVKFNDRDALEKFIGRQINTKDAEDMIKAQAEVIAKSKVIYADALLCQLQATEDEE